MPSHGFPALDPRRVAAENLLLERELATLARALDDRHIPVVALKGVTLARRAYGRLDAREIVDNDLLVRRSDLPRAVECLQQMGYRQPPHKKPAGDMDHDHASPMFRELPSGARLWADLHWNAFPPLMFDVDESTQWAHTEPYRLADRELLVFDPAMTLLHLASHFAQHRLCEPRVLRDLGAAAYRWHTSLDPNELTDLATQSGLLPALAYACHASHQLGWMAHPPQAIPSRRARALAKILPARALTSPAPSRYVRTLLTAVLIDTRKVPRWLGSQAFPPLAALSEIYGEPVSPRLYLKYPTRPFRALRRILKREDRAPTR